MFLSSCAPSYQKLVAFDEVQWMREGLTVFIVEDRADRIDRWQRYGFERKAERMASRDDRKFQLFENVVRENFDFSVVQVMTRTEWNQSTLMPDFVVQVEEVIEYQGDNENGFLALVVRRGDGYPVSGSFPSTHKIGASVTPRTVLNAVQRMNDALFRFDEQRERYLARRQVEPS